MGTHTSDTCPHTAKVFLGRPTTQKGSKKSLRTQKGSKKSLRHWRPMRPSQMGTQTSDKGLFQKGLKKNLTRKPNTCPHTAKVFFGTSHHTKESKKSLRTQKRSKKSLQHWRPMRPSQMGTHTSDTCPHTAKVFLGRPTTQKGSKKSLRTQKVQKKPQVGTHTSDKGLSQKRLKKAWPEPTTRKGSKKSLLKEVGKRALTSTTNAYSHTGDTQA